LGAVTQNLNTNSFQLAYKAQLGLFAVPLVVISQHCYFVAAIQISQNFDNH
jgi:hypothetical protein